MACLKFPKRDESKYVFIRVGGQRCEARGEMVAVPTFKDGLRRMVAVLIYDSSTPDFPTSVRDLLL